MSASKNKPGTATLLDEDILADFAESVVPCRPQAQRQAAMRDRILAGIRAPAPAGTSTVRSSDGEWIRISPSIEVRILRRDAALRRQTALYRLAPGAVLPTHGHKQDEECYVLDGEVNVGDYFLRAGDFHLARAGHDHPEIESKAGALLLIQEAQRSYDGLQTA